MKRIILSALLCALALTATAQERGPVTNLPLPRFVSLKASEANVRRGPSLTHRVDWIFRRQNMPLELTAEYGNWRRIQDRDGAGGWVHYTLLSGVRTILVEADLIDLHTSPRDSALVTAQLGRDVVARILECAPDWCRIRVEGHEGWTPKTALWGVGSDEILD